MGVHGAYVVSALLFHIVPSKSSKIRRIIYLKILVKKNIFSTKWVCVPPWSLQNGRACPHGLYFHVHLLFFFAQSSGSTDGNDVHLKCMFYDLQVCLHVKVSCFRIEVSTGWVCIAYVLFLHCYSILFH